MMQGLQWISLGRFSPWVSAILLMAGLQLPVMADTLYIKKVAEYRSPESVQRAVREECQINTRLPEMIRDEIGKLPVFREVALVEDPLSAKHKFALVASIISLEVPPGAGWSTGTKFLKVKAILYRDGENIGEFVRAERAGRGHDLITNVTRNYSNCKIAEHLADNISEHLAAWIKKQNIQMNKTTSSSEPNQLREEVL